MSHPANIKNGKSMKSGPSNNGQSSSLNPGASPATQPASNSPAINPQPPQNYAGQLLTRQALANALNISVRTVDQMIADQDITPIRLRGKLVRFHLPDVLAEIRARAQTSKHACTRSL